MSLIKGINVITDRREPESEQVAKANRWFSLAKNIVWVLGFVAIVVYKINTLDNADAKQVDDINRVKIEVKTLQADINGIKSSQVDQLVMLTRLLTIVENDRANKNSRGN